MKNTKLVRLLALLMALLMLASLALASCANTGDSDESSDTTETTAGTTAGTTAETTGGEKYDVITIAKALELCGASGNVTTERYYIRGTIKSVTNAQYGAMVIEDETGSISVYGTYSADGSIGYANFEYKPVKGDEVLLHCILQNYNGTKEVKNARLIEYTNNQGKVDVSNYTAASIAEARAAEKGATLKVDGVVARITYADGMKPNGFILVDETASIYVYDGDVAQRLKIGNKVEIAGTKDYWILDSEQNNAAKFGYKGANQLTDVTLVSNDNKTDNDFDKTWITSATVKDIIDTPVTEDITAKIFKVTALVKKVPGSNFVNYYFFDLDGETGTYTYTQCSGSDFAWLDAFDGKICTVYLTALNAKSTATDCYFRLLPVAVYDENFTFDLADTAEHVMDYYVLDQFKTEYTGNPQTELITSVSSELLGFENATVSYSSSNTDVVKFTEADGKLILECLDSGAATVTVTVTYNGAPLVKTLDITVSTVDVHGDTVKSAIDAALDTTVTIEGIVGPSVVNKSAFYLIDNTGVIAVVVKDAAIFEEIEVGQKVVIEGKRNNGDGDHTSQTCITDAVIKANYYGNYEYDTSTFITGKTLADFAAISYTPDSATTVYVLNATVKKGGNAYYTNYEIVSGQTKVLLYCSSGNQYSFLEQFDGQEVTLEVAPCNWNDKGAKACVLSVITQEGKIINMLNFNAK